MLRHKLIDNLAVERVKRAKERVDLSVGQAEDGQVRRLFRRRVLVEVTPRPR